MKSPTHLITAGCSYSQPANKDITWPLELQHQIKSLRYVAHRGHGASGNSIISRKVISTVLSALEQGVLPDQMLVGIMWSGCDRQSHYSEKYQRNFMRTTVIGRSHNYNDFLYEISRYPDDEPIFADITDRTERDWASNPFAIRQPRVPSHYILNPHFSDEMTVKYFESFVNPEKAIIETCEHILRTQWFLKDKGIRYFMTEYDHDVFTYMGPHPKSEHYSKQTECIIDPDKYTQEKHFAYLNNPEINYLYNEIDKNYWLPIKHLQDWVTNVSEFKHRDMNPDTGLPRDPHPSTEQHKDFVAKVVLPFLLEKYNLSSYNV